MPFIKIETILAIFFVVYFLSLEGASLAITPALLFTDFVSWDPRRLLLTLGKGLEVDICKELVPFDVVESEPVVDISVEDPLKEATDDGRHKSVECWHAINNLFVHLHGRRSLEGRLTRHDFADEHAERPDIDAVVVPIADENLRGNVDHCAALRQRLAGFQDLRKAEVNTLDVAAVAHRQHDVLRLQVAVDDLLVVQVLQGQDSLGYIEVALMLHLVVLRHDLT